MAVTDDLQAAVDAILKQPWDIRDGQTVPDTTQVTLAGGAVKLEATFLYADLADSTELAMGYDKRVAAKVFKCYLGCCTRLIRIRGGHVRSFDGDRVMGIFLGDSKNTNAAKCALHISYAFQKLIRPTLHARYEALRNGAFNLAQAVGVDTSEVLTVRSGVRDNNDLVWVGRAPNVAAKLSNIREGTYQCFITDAVYKKLADEALYGGADKKPMWEKRSWGEVQGVATIYRSNWIWKP